ncbi:MAG: metal-dependent transcriptional regulator [Ruminococcaceae bacterium]|nr:metal-dependent transcriptional regulator [Oscillospiraceae bacterium]
MQESGEMYLETILVLSRKGTPVRSLDVARELCVSRPSVSRAMAILKNGKYVLIDKQGYITLSESGLKIAEKIYERHIVLSKFLMNMGVIEETAEKDACRIEHIISDDAFEIIKKIVNEKGESN